MIRLEVAKDVADTSPRAAFRNKWREYANAVPRVRDLIECTEVVDKEVEQVPRTITELKRVAGRPDGEVERRTSTWCCSRGGAHGVRARMGQGSGGADGACVRRQRLSGVNAHIGARFELPRETAAT